MTEQLTLYETGDDLETTYFPASGVISLAVTDGAVDTEVAMVGREGFAGVSAYLGGGGAGMQAVVQHPGTAYEVSVNALHRLAKKNPVVSGILNGYIAGLVRTLAQSNFCRTHHKPNQQIARWLLMYLDRIENSSFQLTHDSLARMLGMRRATVTQTAQRLQAEGLITYNHGQVTITSRRRLEKIVCGCYQDCLVGRRMVAGKRG